MVIIKNCLLFLLFMSFHFLPGQSRVVTIKLSFLQPYCGGARPSKEMQAEARKPKPYAHQLLILVSGSGKVDSVRTSADGKLIVELKPGTYKLFEPWRYYRSTPGADDKANYDTLCLKKESAKNFGLITVTKRSFSVKELNVITAYCDWSRPCIREEKKHMPE